MTRRCVDLHDDAIAVVFSCDGIVMRVYREQDMPRSSFAGTGPYRRPQSPSERRLQPSKLGLGEAPGHHWLEHGRGAVSEQSIGQQNGYRMTLLSG
ncbi:MAG: hypothetical protein ACXW3S_16340 [Rhodoplanes sp.]